MDEAGTPSGIERITTPELRAILRLNIKYGVLATGGGTRYQIVNLPRPRVSIEIGRAENRQTELARMLDNECQRAFPNRYPR